MKSILLLTFVFCLIACKNVTENNIDSSKDLEAINLIRENHVKAVNNTDVELLLKDMSPDVVYLAPCLNPIKGKEALREFIAPLYNAIKAKIEMTPTGRTDKLANHGQYSKHILVP